MVVLSPKQIKEIYSLCHEEYSLNKGMILESSGQQAANYISSKIEKEDLESQFIALVGNGFKAARAVAFSRHLQAKGVNVLLVSSTSEKNLCEDTLQQIKIAQGFGLRFYSELKTDDLEELILRIGKNLIFIDGLSEDQSKQSRDMDGFAKLANQYASYCIAVDHPFGIEPETGENFATAIKANLTLSFDLPLQGLFLNKGPEFVGKIKRLQTSLPPKLIQKSNLFWLNPKDISPEQIARNEFADKDKYGHTLLIGGSHGLTGAVALGSKAALRIGSGLVTASTWEPQYQELVAQITPEIRTGYIPMDEKNWKDLASDLNNRFDSIVIGPGLARSTRARKLVLLILESFQGNVVLDADAINILKLKEDAPLFKLRKKPVVLTPQIEEFARFIAKEVEEIKKNTLEILREVNDQLNSVILLKGPCSFITYPGNDTYINFYPNAGMATGGVGDVLAGILGGVLAQSESTDLRKVVNLAVLIHSLSGDIAAKSEGIRSMSASSLIKYFDKAFDKLDSYLK